ncbi:MAG: GntR family transcriptional regulator [Sphingomonadales bacterium]|nr:GntR family transcriptional regulator [Sphingomonadales bacterium]
MAIAKRTEKPKKPGRQPGSGGVHLAEVATSYIENAIREGRYLPGQRLVEADLAAETKLGIGPIREALRVLAGEGVIDLVPYKGARIRRLEKKDLISILQALKGVGYTGLTLVAEAARQGKDVSALNDAMAVIRMSARRTNVATFMIRVADFHTVVHALSGNDYLDKIAGRLHLNLFHRELATYLPIEDWDGYVGTYEQIAKTLVAGDGDKAVKVFMKHMDNLIARLREEPRA